MKKLTLFFVLAMLLIAISLSGFTDSGWAMTSVNEYGVKYNVWTCTLTTTTADTNHAYTAKTPMTLNTGNPWTLIVNTAGVSVDGTTVPVDLVGGWSTSSAVTGTATIAYTDCSELKAIIADIDATIGTCVIDPTLTTADVANKRVLIPPMPHYIVVVDGGSILEAAAIVIKIVQIASGY